MPRWAMFLIVAPLVLCVGCASAGYLVAWPWLQDLVDKGQTAVTEEMTEAVFRSVSRKIAASDLPADGSIGGDELVLRAADIDVNNTIVPGEVGIETGTSGTWIYGIETAIGPTGISLLLPGVTYSGVPVIENGRVALTQITAGDDLLGFFFSEETFEKSLEDGINRPLAARGLTPVSLTLRQGSMTIRVQEIQAIERAGASVRPDAGRAGEIRIVHIHGSIAVPPFDDVEGFVADVRAMNPCVAVVPVRPDATTSIG